jgi:hypothetical protein
MSEKNLPSRFGYSRVVFALFGGLVGVILSCIYGPRVISWWFEPPVDVGYNCRPATDWAMSRLMMVQSGSMVVGALIFLGFRKVFDRSKTA